MADDVRYAGYSGYGFIDWKTESLIQQTQEDVKQQEFTGTEAIFLTGGNATIQHTRPQQNTFFAPRGTINVSKIILGPGVANISGSVNFDMSHKNIDYFLDGSKIKRNTYFHFAFSDGNNRHVIYQNVWNSINFAASAGGFVTCSIGFNSLNKFKDTIQQFNKRPSISQSDYNQNGYFKNLLVTYWQAGMDNYIESFSITFSQDVTPVYLNNDKIMPSYLRCGTFSVNAEISSFIQFSNQSSYSSVSNNNSLGIDIGNKKVTLKNALIDSKQISQSGIGDVCKYTYTFNSYALKYSDEQLFEISDVTRDQKNPLL